MKSKTRYARQISLPDFGEQGQSRLTESSVLVLGLGGVGSQAAAHMAAAGVGRLTLVDADKVEESNLPRQVFYTQADIGTPKAEALAQRLRLNSHLTKLEPLIRKADYAFLKQCLDDYGC